MRFGDELNERIMRMTLRELGRVGDCKITVKYKHQVELFGMFLEPDHELQITVEKEKQPTGCRAINVRDE